MLPNVVIDARDAHVAELRGWGRYARCLIDALTALTAAPEAGFSVDPIAAGGPGPEAVFELVRLPLALLRRRAALVHVPNCFLPPVRPCPGVVTVHDLAFIAWAEDFGRVTGAKYRHLARISARSADRVIVPSRWTADDLHRRWGIDPARIRVVPEAPALPLGDGPVPDGRYVLAVGDLRQKKNLAALVDAFAALHSCGALDGHRLVLAGLDSGAGSALAARARAAGAPVELTGYLADTELDGLMRGAELLVHPSLYEGFGLVVLEAMARGVPVLAAKATALPETGGDAAAYFVPGAPAADGLAGQLGALLADPARRAVLAERGSERAAAFTWARTARETAAVYRELL